MLLVMVVVVPGQPPDPRETNENYEGATASRAFSIGRLFGVTPLPLLLCTILQLNLKGAIIIGGNLRK